METQAEINVEAKELNELLKTKRCTKHQRKDKKAKRAKLKQQLRKEMRDGCPSSFIRTLH